MSCPECAGRSLASPCPLCMEDDEASELEAVEAGRFARENCQSRDENPFRASSQPQQHADWLLGWDEADQEPD